MGLTEIRQELLEWRRRQRLSAQMRRATTPPARSAFATWGANSSMVPPVRVDNPEFMHIGSDVLFHELAWLICRPVTPGVRPRLVFGDRVVVQRFSKIVCVSEVIFGEDTVIGDHVYVADTSWKHDDPGVPVGAEGLTEGRPIHIGSNCAIGFGSIILGGVTIGDGAYIAAGAVVAHDVPPRGVAVGNPARVVRVYD